MSKRALITIPVNLAVSAVVVLAAAAGISAAHPAHQIVVGAVSIRADGFGWEAVPSTGA
jgi:hypothetical protein